MVSTVLWVIPSSVPACEMCGVVSLPSLMTKRFSPVHSETLPSGASMMASS